MPNKALSVATVLEKNKLASGTPFIVLIEAQIVDANTGEDVEQIFIANNGEDVTFGGQVYTAFPFDIELKQDAGELPTITMKATDYQRTLMTLLQKYGGCAGSIMIVRIVNMANLTAPVEIEQTLELLSSTASDFIVSLTLGMESSLRKTFPRRTQMRDRCSWRYKGVECAYTGVLTTCDLTSAGPNGCSVHANSRRFGGFPGLISRGIQIV